jgi:NADH:ubiquinone oxidoreductase subunit H
MGRGWASNSSYSLLGALRGVAQAISYEVRIILIILSLVFLTGSYELSDFKLSQENIFFFALALIVSFLLMVSFVAETNRSPFDFAEGESELVSGFNIEASCKLVEGNPIFRLGFRTANSTKEGFP